MLFNSYEFIFGFLPLALLLFFFLGTRGFPRAAVILLALASLLFYAWWDSRYLVLLLISIGFNFLIGRCLGRHLVATAGDRLILGLGIAVNLGLLAYFKYFAFVATNVSLLIGGGWDVDEIVLPLGISFFTFTQIAYLVDAYRKEVHEYRPENYFLFVTFFPHLIAGPVLHHAEVVPQFSMRRMFLPSARNFAIGLSIFAIGLFKKVMIADGVAKYSTPVFSAAAAGVSLSPIEAWSGALAYTFQIYFDFSGYSDMAVGLARMFGVIFPANFNSPYKADSIVEFWRRWHMTLSRFLRDYLYIPLGGGRGSRWQRYRNLWLTMLLGGLWHGAGWTFIVWGAWHGACLAVNHAWRERGVVQCAGALGRVWRLGSILLTLLCIIVGWVFFRSDSVATALSILGAMAGATRGAAGAGLFKGGAEVQMLLFCAVVVFALPNVQQMMSAYRPVLEVCARKESSFWNLRWRPDYCWALLIAGLAAVALINMTGISEFLYFQF